MDQEDLVTEKMVNVEQVDSYYVSLPPDPPHIEPCPYCGSLKPVIVDEATGWDMCSDCNGI